VRLGHVEIAVGAQADNRHDFGFPRNLWREPVSPKEASVIWPFQKREQQV
jgi:hypothetical protein